MNNLSDIQQQALQQWNEMGSTTPLNPILDFAYEVFIQPMGIQADAYVYDALGAIEDPETSPTLPGAKFNSSIIDSDWQNYHIIKPLIDFKEDIVPLFDENGLIADVSYLKEITADNPNIPLQNFLNSGLGPIIELNESILSASKLFIDASLELMIRPEAESQEFAKLFLENRRRYAEAVFVLLTKNQEEEQTS